VEARKKKTRENLLTRYEQTQKDEAQAVNKEILSVATEKILPSVSVKTFAIRKVPTKTQSDEKQT